MKICFNSSLQTPVDQGAGLLSQGDRLPNPSTPSRGGGSEQASAKVGGVLVCSNSMNFHVEHSKKCFLGSL